MVNTSRHTGAGFATALLGLLLSLTVASSSVAATSPSRTISPSQLVARQINAMRVSDGLAPGTFTNAYQVQLRQALANSADPTFVPLTPGVLAEYSLWGEVPVTTTPLVTSPGAVVTEWVSQDGWRGTLALTWNLDCVAANAPGCNAHRRAVLSRAPAPHARLVIASLAQRVDVGGSLEWRVATLLLWRAGR